MLDQKQISVTQNFSCLPPAPAEAKTVQGQHKVHLRPLVAKKLAWGEGKTKKLLKPGRVVYECQAEHPKGSSWRLYASHVVLALWWPECSPAEYACYPGHFHMGTPYHLNAVKHKKQFWKRYGICCLSFPSGGLTDSNKNVRLINKGIRRGWGESHGTLASKVEMLKWLWEIRWLKQISVGPKRRVNGDGRVVPARWKPLDGY